MMTNTETVRTAQDFNMALATFVIGLQAMLDAHTAEKYPTTWERGASDEITTTDGPKYVRVVRSQRGCTGRSVYCFVCRETGNIYKARSWKGPELNVPRGNIYAPDALAGCGPYGVAYLRR